MKKRLLIMALNTLVAFAATAQSGKLSVNNIEAKDLPKGEMKQILTWKDNSGEHLLAMSEKFTAGKDAEPNFPGHCTAELFAHHYLLKGGKPQQTWKTYDFIDDCSLVLNVEFIPGAACVTDLDGNGESEVWLVYRLGCNGDASPLAMKIIMHEGTKKYAMRGNQVARIMTDVQSYIDVGGEYEFDSAFLNGNAKFRDFAEKLWDKYKKYN